MKKDLDKAFYNTECIVDGKVMTVGEYLEKVCCIPIADYDVKELVDAYMSTDLDARFAEFLRDRDAQFMQAQELVGVLKGHIDQFTDRYGEGSQLVTYLTSCYESACEALVDILAVDTKQQFIDCCKRTFETSMRMINDARALGGLQAVSV